jgi:2-polyprenyl-6-methoxyphenol hydroxylase-like FAD-dependent oxidoreductase
MNIDVLIAGAGPVGLTMALEVARYGLSVRVIDKNEHRTDKSKAIVVWPRTLELLDRFGPELTERFLEVGLKTTSTNMYSGDDSIDLRAPSELGFSGSGDGGRLRPAPRR